MKDLTILLFNWISMGADINVPSINELRYCICMIMFRGVKTANIGLFLLREDDEEPSEYNLLDTFPLTKEGLCKACSSADERVDEDKITLQLAGGDV